MVFTIKLVDVKNVTALELEQIGRGYNQLTINQDYAIVKDDAIDKDDACLFINIKKNLTCGEEYHLKIEALQHDGTTVKWLVLFTPKGLFKYLTLRSRKVYIMRIQES